MPRQKSHFRNIRENILKACQAVFIAGAVFMCVGFGYLTIQLEKDHHEKQRLSREESSPLPLETIDDLCAKLKISNHSLCNHQQDVYAPDFYSSIEISLNSLSFDEVEELLGGYQWGVCEITASKPNNHNWCNYDLRGDNVFIFSIVFDKDGMIENTFFPDISWLYSD